MTPARVAAVGLIYCSAAVAWFTLGASVVSRTGESDQRLAKEVAQLWGGQHNQVAPDAWFERPRTITEQVQERRPDGSTFTRDVPKVVNERVAVPLVSSRVKTDLKLDQRRKGLLWYDTYVVDFEAEYRYRPLGEVQGAVYAHFAFPSPEAIYDGFSLRLDDEEAAVGNDLSQGITVSSSARREGDVILKASYRSRGLGQWTYSFTASGVARVRDFHLVMTTDFPGIDFPAGTLSPTSTTPIAGGYRLAWDFDSLVTGQKVGMDPPNRLNPGPLAARITFFAPVGLLFFVTVMVILGIIRGSSLHPVNYFFLAAAFFAFHLLLAYLVDHLDIHASFAMASVVSVFLVVSYLRLVVGTRSALAQAGLSQLVFLVLFSYAFFFEGYTGLTITVGAILTLFVLMQITARVDWGKAFARPGGPAQPSA